MDDKDRFSEPAELQADDTISPGPADGKRIAQADAHRSKRSSSALRRGRPQRIKGSWWSSD